MGWVTVFRGVFSFCWYKAIFMCLYWITYMPDTFAGGTVAVSGFSFYSLESKAF